MTIYFSSLVYGALTSYFEKYCRIKLSNNTCYVTVRIVCASVHHTNHFTCNPYILYYKLYTSTRVKYSIPKTLRRSLTTASRQSLGRTESPPRARAASACSILSCLRGITHSPLRCQHWRHGPTYDSFPTLPSHPTATTLVRPASSVASGF